ncbi:MULTISPECIES: ATP-binding cassette domain-containing protein [unclassified Beijerinckia]|uniref:ATP-binding cassette domain-containing protein n=1 Tax=unclassified Beijerinckia TaxID=2638183 RepID=UPI0008980674|nr:MULTISPECIES: ATP-binding cassette domain-containing protein [unclassified Beijerinckia]MDH7795033.1 ABC-2 type transport system ATP-binding protein [Beijerinckia sp. GAS462]SEB84876.1 ABC-2 type transport system ATP-binding protein [Beijerinckia sp. 28-YEA-48]
MDGLVATARAVTKRFSKNAAAALDAVSIDIIAGRMTGLVGPDGAGKTTLIRLLAGLLDPDGGSVEVQNVAAVDADRADIGYMPQRFGLYEDLSVIENLSLYANLRGLPVSEREARFHELLAFTDLDRFRTRLAGKLSGGMKQKLGLACAMVKAPKLLLLDEPGVGVDPVSRRELWTMVRNLAGEGIGVLWSTAYLDEAEKCDTVFLLNEGKLLYAGEPARLTGQIQGRVYRVFAGADGRRKLLERALNDKDVTDGTVQGASLRLVMKPDVGAPAPAAFGAPSDSRIEPTAPRFEDAFVDILGGGPSGTSILAQAYRTIPDTQEPAIIAEKLTKRFGAFTAASDISFSVPRGQIFGLLGPNGAGKSTTFKMLCGLLTPSSGGGRVAGHDLRKARAEARQSLGYMAQKFSLYGDLSVQQNLNFFSGVYGLTGARQREAIERMVEIFHLKDYLSTNSGTMPLGFKQRLALACAVMHQPPVLFLDEPTSGVDPIVRREFWTHINGLVEHGVTVLVTTHFMDEAEYCDRIALIYRGAEIAIGTPDDLKSQAAAKAGLDDPTLEGAFITLIEESDKQREAA